MTEIVCSALREEHFPLAALAAYGLLLTGTGAGFDARLRWEQKPQWTAILALDEDGTPEEVANRLATSVARRKGPGVWRSLPFADVRKMPRYTFAAAFRDAVTRAQPQSRALTDMLCALGTEVVDHDGKFVPSPMCMPRGGQQKWVNVIRDLDSVVSQSETAAQAAIAETLFGPWQYHEEQPAMGWDPAAERLHAYRAQSPTSEGTPKGVRGAVWLAAQALPLLPCAPQNARLATAGFGGAPRGGGTLYLPVWEAALDAATVQSLFTLPFSEEPGVLQECGARGIAALYACERRVLDRGNFALQPARRIAVKR